MEYIKNISKIQKENFKKEERNFGDFPSPEDLPLKELWESSKDKKNDAFYEKLFQKILKKFSD